MKRSHQTAIVPGDVFYQIMFITLIITCLQLTSHLSLSQPIAIEINTNNQSETESVALAANETANSTTPVQSNELSSTSTPIPTSTSTLPPPLPTPLPSKSYPKLYSGLAHLTMDNFLQAKAANLGRTKRMKRSRPNMVKQDSSSPFSLIKLLLTSHLNPPNDYPMSYSLTNRPSTGQFGSVFSNNLDDSLYDKNEFPISFSNNINTGHSRFIQEPLASFYPGTNDLDLIELGGGDDTFDGPSDDWNNQATARLINPIDTDLADGDVNGYSMDPFIPIRSMRRSILPFDLKSQSEMIKPIAMKRKRRLTGLYPLNGVERSPVLGSSLFDKNRYRIQHRLNGDQFD
ncbi:uncharacterized protein LOC107371096 [Tetranychus urticae]|nr:uncharacterized protein LOC107371096 [Tetranychus urticae]